MTIFIDDKLVRIIQKDKLHCYLGTHFDAILDTKEDKISLAELRGNVIIQNVGNKFMNEYFTAITAKKKFGYESLTLLVENKTASKQHVLSFFQLIFAAGGVVQNETKDVLMMKRLGKWDLPKGKAEKGETSKETAEREVEEECGIKVKVKKRICTTWHTYWMKGKPVIKRTKWFAMKCTDDTQMQPQIEEDIEELCWMNVQQLTEAMSDTYASIRYVIKASSL